MEVEWLKKKLPSSIEERRRCVDRDHPELSIVRQCERLGLPRSSWYYVPAQEIADDLQTALDQFAAIAAGLRE